LRCVLGLCVLMSVTTGPALADEVSGTMTAEPSDQPWLGAYKYTLNFSWSTSRGLAHVDLLLSVLACDAFCDGTAAILFPVPAGSVTDTCEVFFGGALRCMGDASVDEPGVLLKFEALPDQACVAGKQGTGTFAFYTNLPPGPSQTYDDVILVKNGQFKDYGDLTGQLPGCELTNATEAGTWGRIKTIFR
jgi:hypothetical protein